MKILFLGPYRQANEIGMVSRLYLNDLQKIGDVTSRPIFIDNISIDKNTVFDSEKHNADNYDYVIQHLPPAKLAYTELIKKNICIPILNQVNLSSVENQKLSLFYKILADTRYAYRLLKNDYKKIKLIKPNLNIIQTTNTFDIGFFNRYKKIYTILDYRDNFSLINRLVQSFAYLSKYQQNYTYILFVHNLPQNQTQALQKSIKEIYENFNIKNKTINTILIPIALDKNSLLAAHNTGDIFINLTDYYQNPINYELAHLSNKHIIDLTDIDYDICYLDQNVYYPDGYKRHSSSNIINAILNNKSNSKTEAKILSSDILC